MSNTRRERVSSRARRQTRGLGLNQLEDRTAPAAEPVASLINVPAEPLLGESLQFTIRFDNASTTDVGFGPYVDLYLDATGADGAGSAPNDGISFTSATYLGTPVTATVLTLTAAGVPHPYAKGTNGNPLLILPPSGFVPGDQLVVLQVPYGSFTATQTPANIVVTTALSNLADVGTGMSVRAQGGFRFGNDALDNPGADPTIVGPAASSTVTPTVFRLNKTYIGPEDETATGPNFPRQYQISVDIATGQVLTNLDLTDVLPAELQFLAVDSTSGPASDVSTPSTTTPGGTLTRRFASVTGTPGAVDAQMTFSFYAPRNTSAGEILDPESGDDRPVNNDARAAGTWDPIDGRDPIQTVTSNVTPIDHTLTLKSIAVQKQMNIVVDTGAPGLSPGDTVEYTINFQVSDYFAFQNVVLNDVFSDGQEYVASSATLSVSDGHGVGGSSTGSFAASNATLTQNFPGGQGSDRLLLAVSNELVSRGFSPNGRLVGGAIPAGGTGGGPPQSGPPLPFGPTQGQVRFRTVVQDRYEINFPSGDPALNPGDPISNGITVSGDLLSVTNLAPNGNNESDTSSASNEISSGTFVKTVYAVNGVLNSTTTPAIKPGDTVTYRLRLTLPTGDVENLRFTDYLPLPIFDVDSTGRVNGFDDVVSGAAPAAGRAKFGPADTFRALSGIIPGVSNASLANSVEFAYGTHDDPTNTPVTVDILFTVTVSTDPFADQLLLSNGVLASNNNTFLEEASTEGIAQIVLQEPVLSIKKGVVATNNPTGVFTPGAVGPVAFNTPGTVGPRFTGTITSAGLAATPINSNLGNIDQGDLVTFAVVVENTGSGPNGAFDLVLRDTLPEGFIRPNFGAFGINVRVTDGAGNPIAFEIVEGGTFDQLGGIRLIDPSATRGAIGPGVVNGMPVQDGSNIIIITFDLLTSGNRVNQIITDVATLTNFANTEGGSDFTTQDLTDDANVQIATPRMTKELIGTEIVNTTNANDEAVIGEIVTYRLRITVPEGLTPNAVLTDLLDPELAFIAMLSSNLPGSVLLQGGSLIPVVTNNGRTITWTLGNIVNNNSSNGTPEVIELVYRVVVLNTADANANDQVNNRATLVYQGGPQVQISAPNIRIIEPQVQIEKSVSVDSGDNRGDAGDPFIYTIVLSNRPGANQFTADAFDLTFRDLFLAGLLGSPLNVAGFTVTDTAGLVSASNFEMVVDPGTGRLILQTTANGAFDLLVDAGRTITIRVNGTVAQTVTPGQVIPNSAEIRWTSLDGNPGQRSPFTPDSTERTGAGGINDYLAADGAAIDIINVDLIKTLVVTSETATTDVTAVVVGEIVRYRVVIAVPEFANPTSFQFLDLLPAGMQAILQAGGTVAGRVAFVTDAGDSLVSTTLTDFDPAPPRLYLTGDENNVDSLVPEFPIPVGIVTFAMVNGRIQITVDLGFVINPASPDDDFEYLIFEFNALVDNTVGNQAGTVLVNEVSTVINGVPTGEAASVAVRVAEPSITDLDKHLILPINGQQVPDGGAHDAGDLIRYAATYSNAVGANVSTAYNVRLTDALPAGKMTLVPGSVVVLRNGVQITTGFTNASAGNTLDVTVDVVAPGDTIAILYDAVLTTGVVAGESVPNTANLTYTSLPGPNGTDPNPTGSVTPGVPGSQTGERTGADGIGGALNDYADTASAVVPILIPDLDKNILDTNVGLTGTDQFDPNLTDLTVGETVTYRITITLPEGTTTFTLTDLLPLLNNGTIVFTSAMVVAIGGNLFGSSLAVGDPGVVTGNTITFNFGTVINLPDGVVSEFDQIVVDVLGQVIDQPENVAGVIVINTATLTYNNGSLTDDAVAEIVEPVLDIQKAVTPGNGDAGDVFTYTLVVTHLPASTSAAFQVLIRDLLSAGNLELIPGSVTVSLPGFFVTDGNDPGDTIVTVEGDALPLGFTLTITYQAGLTGSPLPGAVVPNLATLDYGSYFLAQGGRPYDDEDPAQVTVNASSIAGLIYTDLNNNGVYEPGLGESLITSSVTLRLTGTDHIGNVVDRLVTTTTGAYLFTGLRPSGAGGYTITQVDQPAGFLDGRDTPGTPFGGTGTTGGNPRDTDVLTGIAIPLGSNTAGVNYNFGELLPAAVGDFYWLDNNGNGRQDPGEPGLQFEGLTVTLLGTDDLGAVNLTTTVVGNGFYQFANLRPGTYRLLFGILPGFERTFQDSSVATDQTDSDAAVATGLTADFSLVQGQTDTSRDAGLYVPAFVGDTVWYDIDGNGVQDAGEPGIPGVAVTLVNAGPDGIFGNGDDVTLTTTTDTNGIYFFLAPPGSIRISVSGLPNGLINPTFDLDGIATPNVADLTLNSGDERADVDFGYRGMGVLGDRVWYDLDFDGVQSLSEPGIAGVTVNVAWFGFDGIEGTQDDIVYHRVTNNSGLYLVANLPLGGYRVTVDVATLPQPPLATYDLDSGTINPDSTTLAALTTGQPIVLGADFGYFVTPLFGDRVWLDFNGDGLQNNNEPGLEGVVLTAFWAGNDGIFNGDISERTFTLTTGSNGRYAFAGIPPGVYRVAVTGGLPAGVTQTGDPDGMLDAETTFTIAGNEFRLDIDFGYRGNSAIGDFVWDDTNGNGRQDAGEPGVGGVAVELINVADGSVWATTATDANGLYLFPGLIAGQYQVRFTAPAGTFFTAANQGDDTGDNDADPATGLSHTIALGTGVTDDSVDAGLYRVADIGDFVWYDVSQDGVQEPGEPGVPGVVVVLDDAGIDGVFGTADDAPGVATRVTDGNGGYLFPGLRPGTYRVRVIPLTLPNGLSQPTFDYDGIGTANQATLALGSGVNNRDIDFGYTPTTLFTDQFGDLVWYDVNRDGSNMGEPGIAGVIVNLIWFGFDDNQGTADDVTFSDTTDFFGVYGFAGLPFGRFQATVVAASLPIGLVPTYDFDSGITNPDGTTLAELSLLNPTELRADFGYTGRAGFGDRVWLDFNGDGVQDPDEAGLVGVTVTATWAGPDGLFVTGFDNTTLTTVTGADGIYGFANLPAGTWRASVTGGLPAAVTNTGDPDGTFDGRSDFLLAPIGTRNDIDFGYQGNNSLSGFVYRDFNVNGLREPNGVNPETGIGGVTITLTAIDTAGNRFTRTTTTAADGSYFFDGLPDGDYQVDETQPPSVFEAGAAGFYDGLDTVGSAGGTNPVKNRFAVRFTADIDGVEYNFGENPPADPFGSVYVDLNGNAIRDPGEPGIAGITITVSGVAFPGTPLERPLTAADVPGGLTVVTDADGRWIFPLMPPGMYTLVEGPTPGFLDGDERNGDPNPPQTVVVCNDRFDNMELSPFPVRGPFDFGELIPSSIAGSVYLDRNRNGARDANEPGIANVTVTLTGTDDRGNPVTQQLLTDANGDFQFTGLRPGTYTLTESQPAQYRQGTNSVGSAGGAEVAVDTLGSIPLGPGVAATAYLFGEVNPRPGPVPPLPPLPIIPIVPPPVDPSKREFLSTTPPPTPERPRTERTDPNYQALGSVRPFGDTVYVATAEGIGGGLVRVFDMTGGQERFRFTPFPGLPGGVRVTTADLTGDFIPDIVAAAGPGGGPRVIVYDGNTGAVIRDFFAFEPSFNGGVFVAAGDVDGDGVADLILTPDVGGGPRVRVLASGDPGRVLADFFGIDDPNFRGGARAAVGDLNTDGVADLAISAGAGGGPRVALFDGRGLTDGSLRKLAADFFAFEDTLRNGVYLAMGDVDGDEFGDLAIGAGPGGGPRVTVFNGLSLVAGGGLVPLADFLAGPAENRSGVQVATKDLDDNGRAEIVTGASVGTLPVVQFFDPTAGRLLDTFYAQWAEFTGGVFVG